MPSHPRKELKVSALCLRLDLSRMSHPRKELKDGTGPQMNSETQPCRIPERNWKISYRLILGGHTLHQSHPRKELKVYDVFWGLSGCIFCRSHPRKELKFLSIYPIQKSNFYSRIPERNWKWSHPSIRILNWISSRIPERNWKLIYGEYLKVLLM